MISWLVALAIGALCGWLASKIMNTDAQQGAIANILIGIVGALLAQWLFGNVFGIGGAQAAGSELFDFWSILWGVVGSVVLIGILKLVGVLK